MPPFRERYHAERLLWGVKNGWVDVLASDHAPHTIQEKQAGNVWDVKVGIPGLETTLPLLLTQVNHGLLSIGDIVRLMGEKSALIFGLEGKGSLKEGNDADLTVVDLDVRYKIDASKFHSKAKYSPFDQWEVQGKPVKTFVKGQLIMDDGETIAKAGSGQVIRRN
jgi:dihydroorotase